MLSKVVKSAQTIYIPGDYLHRLLNCYVTLLCGTQPVISYYLQENL